MLLVIKGLASLCGDALALANNAAMRGVGTKMGTVIWVESRHRDKLRLAHLQLVSSPSFKLSHLFQTGPRAAAAEVSSGGDQTAEE